MDKNIEGQIALNHVLGRSFFVREKNKNNNDVDQRIIDMFEDEEESEYAKRFYPCDKHDSFFGHGE